MKAEVGDLIDFLISKAQKEKIVNHIPKPKVGSGKVFFKMSRDFDEPSEAV